VVRETVQEGLADGLRRLGLDPAHAAHGENLPIRVRVDEAAIAVDLGGWVQMFALGPDDETRRESQEFALDLVAAALFGEIRVTRFVRDGLARAFAAEILVAGSWRALAAQGRVRLFERALVTRELLRNDRARPAALRGHGPSGLPTAPWAGSAGMDERDSSKTLTLDGELDLHLFPPEQVAAVVREYIAACHARGITALRIVHGKGKGVQRRNVHAILDRHPLVEGYRAGGMGSGGWGATLVDLRRQHE
jgi:hypothetical protein